MLTSTYRSIGHELATKLAAKSRRPRKRLGRRKPRRVLPRPSGRIRHRPADPHLGNLERAIRQHPLGGQILRLCDVLAEARLTEKLTEAEAQAAVDTYRSLEARRKRAERRSHTAPVGKRAAAILEVQQLDVELVDASADVRTWGQALAQRRHRRELVEAEIQLMVDAERRAPGRL
jgi:hypothetical protein